MAQLKIVSDLNSVEVNRNVYVNVENDPVAKKTSWCKFACIWSNNLLQNYFKIRKSLYNFICSQITHCPIEINPISLVELLGNLILVDSVNIAIGKDVQIDDIYY